MATGQDLRHDFAPAWLKLPSSETSKQNALKFGERSLDRSISERSGRAAGWLGGSSSSNNGSSGSGGGGGTRASRAGLEDNNYTQQPRRARFYSTENSAQSADSHRSFNGDGQRSRLRHVGSHGNRYHEPINGTVSDSFVGNGARSPMVSGSYSPSGKYHADGRSGSVPEMPRNGGHRAHAIREDVNKTRASSIDDEFPSLNGDIQLEQKRLPFSKVHTVWDSPCREPNSAGGRLTSSVGADSTHKALVLKTGLTKRSVNDVEHRPATRSQSSSGSPLVKTNARDSPKELVVGEALSTCLVKQPKNLGDKKSSFLKALRRYESEDIVQDSIDAHPSSPTSSTSTDDQMMPSAGTTSDIGENINASVESLDADDGRKNSAASDVFHPGFTEAEYRLLLEMGWKEPDEDEDGYEITEADVKEFENLCRQLKNSKMPSHNGFSKNVIATTPTPTMSRPFSFAAEVPLSCLESSVVDDDDSSDSSDYAENDPH